MNAPDKAKEIRGVVAAAIGFLTALWGWAKSMRMTPLSMVTTASCRGCLWRRRIWQGKGSPSSAGASPEIQVSLSA